MFSKGGVRLSDNKHTEDGRVITMPPPSTVTLPALMHIGKAAVPTVKAGDEVFVGSLIAKEAEGISSAVYSSVSGFVKSVSSIRLPSGRTCPAVTVISDGNMTPSPELEPPRVADSESFIEAVRLSGIVGLGGAGFPTYAKLRAAVGAVDELIVNACECEPYITCDSVTAQIRGSDIYSGISAVAKHLGVSRIIIALEKGRRGAAKAMQKIAECDPKITVKLLPEVYPQGAEKLLVYNTTGKVIPIGKLPIHARVIVMNSTTLAYIGRYLASGMPLTSRCITVSGGAMRRSGSVIAPIGASATEVIEFAGGFKEFPYKVLFGGPMMGHAILTLDVPIMKTTNAIVALTEAEAKPKAHSACIRCGACVSHCPLSLVPVAYLKAYREGNADALRRLRVDACMECGVCSYVCPTAQPLVGVIKLSKKRLSAIEGDKKKDLKEKINANR